MSSQLHSLSLRSHAGAVAQKGFTLIELIVTLSIIAILSTIASGQLARMSEDVLAQGSGTYIAQVAAAAQRHTLLNFNEYANGLPVAGVAVPLKPTVAELVALGRLNSGFPSGPGSMPTRQQLRIDITKQNCPGPNCVLTALACTTTPVTLGGPYVRFDLAQTMVDTQGGSGGQSSINFGNVIRGPAINVPNPVGNVEGIVCGSSVVDTALFQRFVTIQDTRDPDLKGPLSVAGAVNLAGPTAVNNTLSVTGAMTAAAANFGPCIKLDGAANGRGGFGCQDPQDVPAGYVGGVRSKDVVANGSILASDNPGAFTGANGAYAIVGVSGGVGEVRTSGRAAADRLTPLGAYAPGSGCAAADEGSISKNSGGTGLVVCQTGQWRAMATQSAAGGACAPEGSMATSGTGEALLCVNGMYQPMSTIVRYSTPNTACTTPGTLAIDTTSNNESLICRANLAGGPLRYMRMRDVTAQLAFVQSYEVTDGSTVVKPACNAPAAQPAVPVLQLIPKIASTPDGGTAIYATDPGGAAPWTVFMRSGTGAPLVGSPRAIAQVYCYFP